MILTVFRSRLRPEAQAEYGELAPQMSKLARSMPRVTNPTRSLLLRMESG